MKYEIQRRAPKGDDASGLTGVTIDSGETAVIAPDSGGYSGDYHFAPSDTPKFLATIALCAATLEAGGEMEIFGHHHIVLVHRPGGKS